MEKLVITGGKKLAGTVAVSGSKNAALPLMTAALLAPSGKTVITNTPDLKDVHTLSNLLRIIGAKVEFENHVLKIDATNATHLEAPYELVKKMRASIYVLGPMLARHGRAKVSLPGGCAWGPRPVDLHLEAMKKLGASIELDDGYIIAKAKRGSLVGAKIKFKISSVGATANALMACILAKGMTRLENAAIEPEVTALAKFLVKMGAKIEGIGTTRLDIEGTDDLFPVKEENISDRIEAGTLLTAAAITGGKIKLTNVTHEHLKIVLKKLEQTGCRITTGENTIELSAPAKLKAVSVEAKVYPGFPTDMQAQWTALMTQADGTSKITDTIYADRFKHIPELNRLGAGIETKGNASIVKGKIKLAAAKVMSTDLRASASLILAGLVAHGTTDVLRVYHLDRGYEKIEDKLKALGAIIHRERYDEFQAPKPDED